MFVIITGKIIQQINKLCTTMEHFKLFFFVFILWLIHICIPDVVTKISEYKVQKLLILSQ